MTNRNQRKYYKISLADDPKIMALSSDSIFLGLPTGLLFFVNCYFMHFYSEVQVIKPIEPSNNF